MKMRLETLRIVNCFGFRDSGEILLADSNNIILLLGRNSSGKTAVITALEAISSSRLPKDYERFKNFEPIDETRKLVAKYSRNEYLLSADDLTQRALEQLEQQNVGQPFLKADRFVQFEATLRAEIQNAYSALLEQLNTGTHVWVHRDAEGNYYISHDSDAQESFQRTQMLQSALDRVFQQYRAPNTEPSVNVANFLPGQPSSPVKLLAGYQVENLLFKQFPQTGRFGGNISLSDSLPDCITLKDLSNTGSLTSIFIDLLNRSKVEAFLRAHNPRERTRLLQEMQSNLDVVVSDVNHYGDAVHQGRLLDMQLAEREGLQVTVLTEDKYSYYRHLSDNTKLLFTFYLLIHMHQAQSEILLFDEPNNGFHASAQEELLRFLKKLGEDGHLVVVATHSEYLIDPDHLTGIRRMDVDPQGDYLYVRNKWNVATSGKGDYLALRPIMDAIGLRYGANKISGKDCLIVTEEPSAWLYLLAFQKLCSYPAKLNVYPANGDSAIAGAIAFLISQGLRFKIVVDTTEHKKSAKTRIQEAYPIDDHYFYEIAIPSDVASASGSGIEDVFSKAALARILTDMGQVVEPEFATVSNNAYLHDSHRRVPKLIVATWFQQNVSRYTLEAFDAITRERIESLMNFCSNDIWYKIE